MNNIITSELARQAVQIGFKNHYRFRPVTLDAYKEEWVTERVTIAPVEAQERIETLKRSGVRIKSIIVAHEAPRLLVAPAKLNPTKSKGLKPTTVDPAPFFQVLGFVFAMFFQAILLDPAVLVELEDGSMVEVCQWFA